MQKSLLAEIRFLRRSAIVSAGAALLVGGVFMRALIEGYPARLAVVYLMITLLNISFSINASFGHREAVAAYEGEKTRDLIRQKMGY